jgi:hypothetical protein
MSKYARVAPGRMLGRPLDIERPFSNFDFIEKEFEGLPTIRRIMSQVRSQDGRTMIVEQLGDCDDLREENEDIRLKCPGFSESNLYPYPLSRQKTVLSKVDSSPYIKAVGTEGARRATGVPTAAPYTSAGVR